MAPKKKGLTTHEQIIEEGKRRAERVEVQTNVINRLRDKANCISKDLSG